MSKKVLIIIALCVVLCAGAVLGIVLTRKPAAEKTDNSAENEIISRETAIEYGSQFLKTNYTIPEGDTIDAVLEGAAWKVYNIPGETDVDENGAPLEYIGSKAYVYVRADTGEFLTTGIYE